MTGEHAEKARRQPGLVSELLSFFRIGVIGFGGGNALVPVMREAFVEKKKVISDSSFHDKVFVANITPGALPVELACGIGKETSGWKGMILAPLLLALPGAVGSVLLLSCFSVLDSATTMYLQLLSVVISVYILYQLFHYIKGMFQEARQDGKVALNTAIFLITAWLVCGRDLCELFGIDGTYVPEVSSTLLMLCVLVIAFVIKRPRARIGIDWHTLLHDESLWLIVFVVFAIPATVVCSGVLQLLFRGGVSALVSFGGGDAYLGIADDLFVQSGMFTTDEFYGKLVTAVNILPGSILCKMLTGMGYILGARVTHSIVGGYIVSVAAFMCGVFFSCASYLCVENIYNTSRKLEVFAFLKKIVKPIVSAFMLSVIITLLQKDVSVLLSVFGG